MLITVKEAKALAGVSNRRQWMKFPSPKTEPRNTQSIDWDAITTFAQRYSETAGSGILAMSSTNLRKGF